ncbi:MAG: CPBP family intramembrane glutamic endopeptidase, partial [Vulcanococcus sp.]
LEQALLLQRTGDLSQAQSLLKQLRQEGGAQQAIATVLLNPEQHGRQSREQLLAELKGSTLVRQWSCEALLGAEACQGDQVARQASVQLLAVTLVPGLGLLGGIALLIRELWRRWRGKTPAAPPWLGPALSGIDTVLLVAGGFVVVGELITPLLVAPLLTRLLQDWPIEAVLKQGISVVVLYGALMTGPLLILRLLLKPLGPGPQGGWLQFRWSPLPLCFGQALKGFLMVLPLVSLVGWLQGQLFGDPGGSNPLLELVLNGHNIPALACFGVTAIVLAPLFEETIFRGALLPVAARYWGSGWGIVVSAAVFAVAHSSLGEFPPLMVLGLGLGWLRWRSGRLGSCVLMHALWNSLTFANLVVLGW